MKSLLLSLILIAPLFVATAAMGQSLSPTVNAPYRILAKPSARYTDRARAEGVEGSVRLKVTLLANGEVGDVEDFTKKNRKKLSKYGLTASAIAAARLIKFTPKVVNGSPVTVSITLEYIFSIY